MSSKEEERQALLEKIRADMAASRQKINEMKEKKARGTLVLDTSSATAETKAEDAKKFEETSSLVDKLRAERAAKKLEAEKVASGEKVQVDSPMPSKKVVIVRKNVDGSEERIVKEIALNVTPQEGGEKIASPVRKVSVASDTRQRSPSIGERFRPDMGRMRKPSMDQGARIRGISIDQGNGSPRTRTPSIDTGQRRKSMLMEIVI